MSADPTSLISRKTGNWWQDDRRNWCAYCGSSLTDDAAASGKHRFTRDHVIAKMHGGNLTIPSCRSCNLAKGTKSAAEFLVSKYFESVRNKQRPTQWPLRNLWLVMAMAAVHQASKHSGSD